MNMTSDLVLKLFVVCLSWQWRQEYCGMWTTMDKVVRIVGPRGLGILSERDIKGIRRSQYFRGLLKQHARVFAAEANHSDTQSILAVRAPLAIRVSINKDVDWRRVVRDTPIFLTSLGVQRANQWEAHVAPLITKERYLSECRRQEEIAPRAMPAVIDRYRKVVRSETETDGGAPRPKKKSSVRDLGALSLPDIV